MAALGFFRKNTKMVIWIMVALMGVFLLGAVGTRQLTRWLTPAPGERVIGTITSGEVTFGDLDEAEKDISILRQLGLGQPGRSMGAGLVPGERGFTRFLLMAGDSERKRHLGWTLLVREARSMGFEAEDMLIDRFVRDGLGMDAGAFGARLAAFRKSGVVEETVRRALGNYLIVTMAFESASRGAMPSEPRLRRLFKDAYSRMDVAMIPFNAGEYLEDVPAQPSGDDPEAVLRKMWNDLKTYTPGSQASGHRLKFGYRRPGRIRLEYAYIAWDDVADMVEPANDEIYDYWQEHPEEFTPAKDKTTTTAPAETTTAPAERSYSADKPKAREKVRQVHTALKIKKLIDRLRAKAKELEPGKPADASLTALEEAAEGMTDEILVRYRYSPRWMTVKDIATDPLLKNVYTSRGVPLVNLAFFVKELLPADKAHLAVAKVGKLYGRPMAVIYTLNGKRDPTRPLRGLLVWRVVGAQPSAVPTVFDDEMRKRVTADWRLDQAYEIAATKARKAKVRVTEVGMADVAKELKTDVIEAKDLSRKKIVQGFVPRRGENYEQMMVRYELTPPSVVAPGVHGTPVGAGSPMAAPFLNSVFELATDAESAVETTTAPAPADAVKVIGLPEAGTVLLVERLKYSPAYEQDLLADNGALHRGLMNALRENSRFEMMMKWYQFEEIRVRTGYEDAEEE